MAAIEDSASDYVQTIDRVISCLRVASVSSDLPSCLQKAIGSIPAPSIEPHTLSMPANIDHRAASRSEDMLNSIRFRHVSRDQISEYTDRTKHLKKLKDRNEILLKLERQRHQIRSIGMNLCVLGVTITEKDGRYLGIPNANLRYRHLMPLVSALCAFFRIVCHIPELVTSDASTTIASVPEITPSDELISTVLEDIITAQTQRPLQAAGQSGTPGIGVDMYRALINLHVPDECLLYHHMIAQYRARHGINTYLELVNQMITRDESLNADDKTKLAQYISGRKSGGGSLRVDAAASAAAGAAAGAAASADETDTAVDRWEEEKEGDSDRIVLLRGRLFRATKSPVFLYIGSDGTERYYADQSYEILKRLLPVVGTGIAELLPSFIRTNSDFNPDAVSSAYSAYILRPDTNLDEIMRNVDDHWHRWFSSEPVPDVHIVQQRPIVTKRDSDTARGTVLEDTSHRTIKSVSIGKTKLWVDNKRVIYMDLVFHAEDFETIKKLVTKFGSSSILKAYPTELTFRIADEHIDSFCESFIQKYNATIGQSPCIPILIWHNAYETLLRHGDLPAAPAASAASAASAAPAASAASAASAAPAASAASAAPAASAASAASSTIYESPRSIRPICYLSERSGRLQIDVENMKITYAMRFYTDTESVKTGHSFDLLRLLIELGGPGIMEYVPTSIPPSKNVDRDHYTFANAFVTYVRSLRSEEHRAHARKSENKLESWNLAFVHTFCRI